MDITIIIIAKLTKQKYNVRESAKILGEDNKLLIWTLDSCIILTNIIQLLMFFTAILIYRLFCNNVPTFIQFNNMENGLKILFMMM